MEIQQGIRILFLTNVSISNVKKLLVIFLVFNILEINLVLFSFVNTIC
jgi:hypothetical protein